MVGFPWTAYGVSQAMYYRKSMAENTTGGIKFESVIAEAAEKYASAVNCNAVFDDGIDPFAESVAYDCSDNVDDYQI